MLNFIKRLLGMDSGIKFECIEVDNRNDAPVNAWFRVRDMINEDCLLYKSEWDNNWKKYADYISVAGITHENRINDFLLLGNKPDFSIRLEKEPGNRYDKNAVMVIGSATINGIYTERQLGYLPKDTAKSLKNETIFDARPDMVWFPNDDRSFGLKITVLVPSKRSMKKA